MKAIFLLVLFIFVFLLTVKKMFHLMPTLIMLEVLSLIIFLFFILILQKDSIALTLFLLVIMSSESVLGLVLFVLFTRKDSKDYIGLLNMVKF